MKGLALFLQMTNSVIELEESFRQDEDEKEFKRILPHLRLGTANSKIAKRLMSLHRFNYTDKDVYIRTYLHTTYRHIFPHSHSHL